MFGALLVSESIPTVQRTIVLSSFLVLGVRIRTRERETEVYMKLYLYRHFYRRDREERRPRGDFRVLASLSHNTLCPT